MWLALAIAGVATFSISAQASLAISPGLIASRDVTPGAPEVDLMGNSTTSFLIHNTSDTAQGYSILVEKPSGGGWELGYEAIPDISWLRTEPAVIDVAPKSVGKFKVFIKVPAKPEYYNRKWMAYAIVTPGKEAAKTGNPIGLRVACRLQIETVNNASSDGVNAGNLSIVPSEISANADAGVSFDQTVKVRNNTDAEHTYTIKGIKAAEAEGEKHPRYYGPGFEMVKDSSWVEAKQTFTLKPNETLELKLKVQIPAATPVGKKYEELLFFFDEKGCKNFLRIRTEIPKADGK